MLKQSASSRREGIEMDLVVERGESAIQIKLGDEAVVIGPREVDELIETLGLFRVDVRPAVPSDIRRNHQFPLETQPVWQVITDHELGRVMLFFRHSGYGWTGFAMPYSSVIKLLDIDPRTVQSK